MTGIHSIGRCFAVMSLLAQPALAADPLGGGADRDGETLIIGSADFPESQLLAAIYGQALQAEGLSIQLRNSVGSREVYMPALLDGSLDLVPEYTGALLLYLDGTATATAPEDVAKELAKVLPAGVSMLEPSPAQDRVVLAVTQDTAGAFGLKTMSDLAEHASGLTLGGPPEWKTRPDGLPGLEKVYGMVFEDYRALDVCGPLTISALVNDQIQASCLFSTNPAIEQYSLVALDDDKNMIPAQNVSPIIASSKLTDELAETLNKISAELTTEDLITLNGRIANHESIEAIAADWFEEHAPD